MDELIRKLQELLDDMDDLDETEELIDLNATLEDVIFLLEEDEDAGADAHAELTDIQKAYERLGLSAYANRLVVILRDAKVAGLL